MEARRPLMNYVMGQARDLSASDLRRINKMYSCSGPRKPQGFFRDFLLIKAYFQQLLFL